MKARRIVIAGAAALALAAGGTAAGAAIAGPVGSDGIIHGCYDSGGNVKVVDASASCPKGYTPLNWSVTGPQGPQGATGPAGATGATGAQGPPGPSGASIDSGIITIGISSNASGITCSMSDVTGPDASSITATAHPYDYFTDTSYGCDISGLPASFVPEVTSIDESASFGVHGTGSVLTISVLCGSISNCVSRLANGASDTYAWMAK
jgi:hypothetical protein